MTRLACDGESLQAHPDLPEQIQVLRIGRDNVRLGIKAPSHISIYRYEIYEAIKQENVNAVQSQIPDKSAMETLKGVFRVETKEE